MTITDDPTDSPADAVVDPIAISAKILAVAQAIGLTPKDGETEAHLGQRIWVELRSVLPRRVSRVTNAQAAFAKTLGIKYDSFEGMEALSAQIETEVARRLKVIMDDGVTYVAGMLLKRQDGSVVEVTDVTDPDTADGKISFFEKGPGASSRVRKFHYCLLSDCEVLA